MPELYQRGSSDLHEPRKIGKSNTDEVYSVVVNKLTSKQLIMRFSYCTRLFCPGLILIFLLTGIRARAQNDSTGAPPYSIIKINFEKQRLEPFYLPFDVPFVLTAPAADSLGIDSIRVVCRTKGKCNRLDTVFSTTLKKDLFFRDTIYQNIQTLLFANKTYTFGFKVFRGITKKEDSILGAVLRPTLQRELSVIYNSTVDPNDGNHLVEFLKDHDKLDQLVTVMRFEIDSLYKKRNLDIRTQIDAAVDYKSLGRFIAHTYLTPLTNKRSTLQNIQSLILTQIDNTFYPNPASDQCICNWDLFKLLDNNSDTFKITPFQKTIIHNVLRDADTLKFCIHGVTGNPYKEIWDSLNITTAGINNYIRVSTSFKDSCAVIANLLKEVRKDPAVLGRVIKRKYPGDVARQNSEYALVTDQMNRFINSFLVQIQRLNGYLVQYMFNAVDLDNAYANLVYHLRTEFEIQFEDKTVGLTSADFITRGAWYIIPDVGFAAINAAPSGSLRPYLGVNFNFFPVNRQVPYSLVHPSPHKYTFVGNFVRNLSLTAGVTIFNSFSGKDRYADLLGTTGSLLTGLALRVSDGIRLSGGACWVYKKNDNPLSDMKTLATLGYAALSIDLNLKKWLGGFGSAFFK
jgi:hypothetical protein